jgi:protease-4
MGGLDKAIDIAAHDANLGTNYAVVEYPEKKPFLEELADSLHGDQQPLVKNDFASRVMQKVMLEWRWLSSFNDPNGVYTRLPFQVDLN